MKRGAAGAGSRSGAPGKVNLRREFGGKWRWRLWNGPVLGKYMAGRLQFFDELDPALAGTVTWHVGVDIHKLSVVIALYGRAGDSRVLGPIASFDTTPQGLEELRQLVRPFAPARFLMETSGVYHVPVYWFLEEAFPDSHVVAMNARLLSSYIRGTRKSDKADAAHLAQVASYGELVRPSYVPPRGMYSFREQTRYRERLVRDVTRQKNRVKKVLSAHGFHWRFNFDAQVDRATLEQFLRGEAPPRAFVDGPLAGKAPRGEQAFDTWRDVEVGRECREVALVMLLDLRVKEEILKLAEREVEMRARTLEGVSWGAKLLEGVPGLGHLECLSFLAEVGDVGRFPTAGHFLVYAGIAPRGGTSGARELGGAEEKVVARDSPNMQCNHFLKRTLTRVAASISRNCARGARTDDLYLAARTWKERFGRARALKAIYKIAAKLGRLLFAVLKSSRAYDGDHEKGPAAAEKSRKKSRAARRRQLVRKTWQARKIAERSVEALLQLLLESGVSESRARAILAGDLEGGS